MAATAKLNAQNLAVEPETGNFEVVSLIFNQTGDADTCNPDRVERCARGTCCRATRQKTAVARVSDQRSRGAGEGRSGAFRRKLCFSCSKASASIDLDAIKIDVRGMRGSHPGTILFGARGGSCRPRLLIIEDAGDAWSMDLFSFLVTTGYRDCSAQQAKCDVTPGERSPLAARNLARVGAFP